jgi:hypothetical protein
MGIAAKIVWHARSGDLMRAASRRMHLTNPPLGHSARRINSLFDGLPGADRYLEIGLEFGYTFKDVQASVRWGVDPNPQFDIKHLPPNTHVAVMTSDEFFKAIDPGVLFDVVFLDGLHTFRQTYRDLVSALRVCPQGVILIDDVVPSDEVSAIPDQEESFSERSRRGLTGYPWHGDVFRVLLCIKKHHPELSFRTIVGTDNPQALVWRNEPGIVSSVAAADLDIIENVSYVDVFGHRIPDSLNPRTEVEAIEDWKTSFS